MPYSRPNPNTRPNVLLILCDQLRHDTVGINGNSLVQTPTLDRLAGEGVNFSNLYVQNPTCGPSRGCILTGRYARSHGLRRNGCCMPEEELTMPEALRNAGYHTTLIGKLHFYPHQVAVPHHPDYGFDNMLLADQPVLPRYGNAYLKWCQRRGLDLSRLWAGRRSDIEPFPFVAEKEFHFSEWVAEEAIRYLRNASTLHRPFFLNLSFFDPHPPYTSPEPWFSKYDPAEVKAPDMGEGLMDGMPPLYRELHEGISENLRKGYGQEKFDLQDWQRHWRKCRAVYHGMTEHMDTCIGRVIQEMERLGYLENTVVCFLSDHGEMQGDKGLGGKGPYHFREITRVPAFIRAPASCALRQGNPEESLVESIDLMPTIFDLCDVPIPYGVQGVSMVDREAGRLRSERDSVLIEDFHELQCSHVNTLLTDRWRYSRREGEPEHGELYDLENDPLEHHNLWEERSEVKNQMADLLLERLMASHDRTPPPHCLY